jgi:hypothetical protein
MRKRHLFWSLFILICLLVGHHGYGQSTKIVPPTPNAMKMTEFHAQRPNMYTGTANVSIPLHTINFDGWDLPLSLSYNATGIRPNEEASEVGLGWVLNATGTISRTIRGGDDLFPGSNLASNKGYVYNDFPINTTNLGGTKYDLGYDRKTASFPPVGSYYLHVATQNPDTQPDIFNYNFFGYSGSFTLSQLVSGPIKALKITQDACKVTFDETTKSFVVITPQGYKGEFTVYEKSTTFSGSFPTPNRTLCCGYSAFSIQDMINKSGRLRTITTWYLSKITSPRGQQIIFKYDLRSAANDGIAYYPAYANGEAYSPYISNTRSFGELEDILSTETCIQTVQEHVYLDSIISPDVKVKFLMETRDDLRRNYFFAPDSSSGQPKIFHRSENLKRYNGINIKGKDPASTLNKVIVLKQRYFNQQFQDRFPNNQNETELRWLRSRLDRVNIDDQEYQFYYENGTKGLPNKLTRGIDHFGFYNGKDQNIKLLPPYLSGGTCRLSDTLNTTGYYQLPERWVDFNYGKAGLLSKVKYPTRGWTSFEYEPHVYLPDATLNFREISGEKTAGGARIKTIKEYDYANNQVPVLTKSYRYTDEEDSPSTPSTGKLMTPLYNRYLKFNLNPNPPHDKVSCVYYFQTYSSIPGNNSAEGKVIGYSKVHEIVIGGAANYKNTYDFENTSNTVANWNLYSFGKPNLNGQLIRSRNYNSEGKIVQHVANDDREHNLGDIPGITYVNAYGTDGQVSPYYIFHTYTPIKQVFNTPYKITTTIASSPSGIVEDTNGNIVTMGSSTQIVTDLAYNAASLTDNFLLKSKQTINSKNELILKEFRRAPDYTTPSTTLAYMKSNNVNIIEPVIEEITKLNGTVVSASGSRYELENGRVNLKSTYAYNTLGNFISSADGFTFGGGYELSEDFSNYDPASGRLLQYTDRGKVMNSFIWGYNTQLPIVHGVGLTNSQLMTAHNAALANGAWGTNTYETTLRNQVNTVGKQVTTFVHNPQVGVTKITDGNTTTKSFDYDGYSRLQKVVDKDGYTSDQYQYHFRERQPTRVLTVSGSLNFGVLTPDMFAAQFDPTYIRCSNGLRTRVLTLTNEGEDDLQIDSIFVWPPASAFSLSWKRGEIAPGTSIDVVVSFNSGVPLSNYSGTVVISSNRTNVNNIETPISANYTNRVPSVSFSPVTGSNPVIYDLGTVTGLVAGQYIDVTNNGNAPFRIVGLPLGWNGTDTNYGNYTNPDFSVSYFYGGQITSGTRDYGQCISVGQTVRVPVTFNPTAGPNGIRSAKLSLITDIPANAWSPTLYENAVTLQANLQRPISTIAMNVSTIALGNFTQPFVTTPVTITNTGSLGFTVSGISFSNPAAAPQFSITPQVPFPFVLNPNQSMSIDIKFQPLQFDLDLTTNIIVNNDAMNPAWEEIIEFSGKRISYREMALSTQQTGNELWFDNTAEQRTVTITNLGNDNLSVTGLSLDGGITKLTNFELQYWRVVNFNEGPVAPGGSLSFNILRKPGSPDNVPFTILSNKNGGTNTFTVKARTRVLKFYNSSTIITFLNLPVFTVPNFISQNLIIKNEGNADLTVSSISGANAMFSLTPQGSSSSLTSFSIPAGGQLPVTFTYTSPALEPTRQRFNPQSAVFTFSGNQSDGGTSSFTVTGQRNSYKELQLSTTNLQFNMSAGAFIRQPVTITNTGNDYIDIEGLVYCNTANPCNQNWDATIDGITVSTLSVRLAPSDFTTMRIMPKSQTPETINISVISSGTTGNKTVQVSAITRMISLTPPVFTSFTTVSSAQSMVISNASGNSPLAVTNITGTTTNGTVTISPTSLTIAPGASQSVSVTFTPNDFSTQTISLSVESNATNNAPGSSVRTTSASAKRDMLCALTASPTTLNVTFSNSPQYGYITNTGNVNYIVTSLSASPTPPIGSVAYQFLSGGGIWVDISSYPFTLTPGKSIQVKLMYSSSAWPTSPSNPLTNINTNSSGCPNPPVPQPAISLVKN